MEKISKLLSNSKFISLTRENSLHEYCLLLDKVHTSPNKYNVVNNDIEYDPFGNPFIIFQYYDKSDEVEQKRKKMDFYGEIIDVHDLEKYDSLVNSHLANDIKIIFIKLCTEKLTESFRLYYIVIYVKPTTGYVIEEGQIKKPKEKSK